MNKIIYVILSFAFVATTFNIATAGNPDRQGEAGAYELLMNPWARSAGLHTMTTSCVRGVEAMRLNVAGLSRINKTEVLVSHTRYLEGTDIRLNAFGISQRVGKSGAFGLSLMSVDFGDTPVTTLNNPAGTGATYSPNFFNLGLGYSHIFENKVSVGLTLRGVSESTSNVSAFALAIDAGVQYVTGPQDNFKIGISLRNIGSRMKFSGEALSFQTANPDDETYGITVDHRAAEFQLPSVLNMGLSYDFIVASRHRVTLVGNFTSNSFSQDQIGGGVEYSFNELFTLRGGYKYEFGETAEGTPDNSVYTGLAGGLSIDVPFKKGSDTRLGIDYAYRATNPWDGSHSVSIRIGL